MAKCDAYLDKLLCVYICLHEKYELLKLSNKLNRLRSLFDVVVTNVLVTLLYTCLLCIRIRY